MQKNWIGVIITFFYVLLSFTEAGADRLIMRPENGRAAMKAESGRVAASPGIGRSNARMAIRDGRRHEWRLEGISPVREECILDASRRFNVPVSLILAVMDVEGGEVGCREGNRNGTWDMGPMQVNTCHMEELAPFGLTKREIEANGCLNVMVGTWLLKKQIVASNGRFLEAVGRYHSRNEPHKSRYQRKAINAYAAIKANPSRHVDRIIGKANAPFRHGR